MKAELDHGHTVEATRKCQQCDTPMASVERGSACTKCLLGVAMKSVNGRAEKPSSQKHPDWVPPRPAELQRMLPKYEISGLIGRGGMAAVYKGIQHDLDRAVAIKVLPEVLSQVDDDFNFVDRFRQEALAMARLEHPGIVSVYDFGETDEGLFYFVMEHINGTDLHQYLQDQGGVLSQDLTLPIISQVLAALDCAHSSGIIHRDIKPANILLNKEGRVKITDFGLAKRYGESENEHSIGLTTTNATVGTSGFLAPESLMPGKKADQRADLYAVGVMLYRMLTGRMPRESFEKPSEIYPELDVRLDFIVDKAMQMDPYNRYDSAASLRADIEQIINLPGSQVTGKTGGGGFTKEGIESRKRRVPRVAFSIGIASAALVTIGGLMDLMEREYSGNNISERPEEAQVAIQVSSNAVLPPLVDISSATSDKPFENSLGMRFVPVPITGGPTDGQTVLFSIWETRVKDYQAFIKTDHGRDRPDPIFPQGENHPVVNVTWEDAVAFCEWLTKKEHKSGLLGTNQFYRLPTDHEWSCAVGIGEREDAIVPPGEKKGHLAGIYPWGWAWPPPKGAGNFYGEECMHNPYDSLRNPIKGYNDGYDRTAPVGSFEVNQHGLYDMGGNISEWCQDFFDSVKKESHVLRGSSWNVPEQSILRSSYRGYNAADAFYLNRGFRMVIGSK